MFDARHFSFVSPSRDGFFLKNDAEVNGEMPGSQKCEQKKMASLFRQKIGNFGPKIGNFDLF